VSLVQLTPGGYEQVEISVPNLQYLYPANALTLASTSLVSTATTYTGRLSAGNTNYKGADPAGTTVAYIVTNPAFTLSSPATTTTFNYADLGVINAVVNGAASDSFDLLASFNESNRAGTQTYTPATSGGGLVTVTSVTWYNSFPAWQKGNARLNVSAGALRIGYNSLLMQHASMISQPNQSSNTVDIFYDQGVGTPAVTTPTVAEVTPVFGYLSGVKYYTTNSTFNASAVATNCFNNTYHQTSPITYASGASGALGTGNIDWNDASVTGLSSPPVISETMTITNKVITVPSSRRDLNARLTMTPRKPWSTGTTQTSASANRLVDSMPVSSTAKYEYFDDEYYRLPASAYDSIPGAITGQWTSSTALTNGQAQEVNGSLIYPTVNYSTYLPTQAVDYSAFSGNQVYYRAIYSLNNPNSNGVLELGNLVNADVSAVGSGNVNVEIKLPTQTGWIDLGKPYDSGTFTGIDGDGGRVSQTGSSWTWTVGTFSTAYSGWMYIVRITIRVNTKSLTQIRELGAGW
jgi:hypothetical protein